MINIKYCNSLIEYSKFFTREVNIGGVLMGGTNPIRIQSMTNTHTMDTDATVEQCIRIINTGADYVRITAPGIQDAENLANIKKLLRSKGYQTPLIADIHFNPKAAEVAASIVEKVRINPGNYTDKKRFEQLDFTDKEYAIELEKVHQKLLPLLKICQTHGTAIRIGVNHGSLSDRIMSRYGDTPKGMVEAAMEFLRICAAESFHNLVISLKSSNTRVMVQAYRLLVATMMQEKMNYPLHLGVTEAGDGEDGRIKSAVGIGSLLADGLGDTIRVSLSEDPEAEIPVAKELVKYFSNRKTSKFIEPFDNSIKNPFEYSKRESIKVENIGGNQHPIVIADYSEKVNGADFVYLPAGFDVSKIDPQQKYIYNLHDWFKTTRHLPNVFPLATDAEFNFYGSKSDNLNFVILSLAELTDIFIDNLNASKNVVLIVETFNSNGVAEQRAFFYNLLKQGINVPLIINRNYCEEEILSLQLKSACDIGLLLIDGFGDGVWIRNAGKVAANEILSTSLGILQASRVRTSKTEYISCPSCGRTLFDLQTTIAKIKERTSHLKHLKIGIMGCIVNGPGEMADADYGYVGAAAGKVTLYKGKDVVTKNIPAEEAVEKLIQLIKDNGDWIENVM
jgi:(E)-4-hydroxy-3-methylbut-2-enyl-diphosphate synthase